MSATSFIPGADFFRIRIAGRGASRLEYASEAYKIGRMKRVAHKFRSFQEEAAADRAFYRGLTPAERLKIWLQICRFDLLNAPEQRLQRVYRITPLGGR